MIFLPWNSSKARWREAENARRNRAEIVQHRSWGKVTRRELLKWGLFTTGGLIAAKHGLSPFAKSAFAQVPTGTPLSPFPRRDPAGNIIDTPFIQPMLRLHNLTRYPLKRSGIGLNSQLVWPAGLQEPNALRRANTQTILHTVNLANADNTGNISVSGTTGPQEGRPPGEAFAHQRWNELVNGAAGLDGQVSNPLPPVGIRHCHGQIVPGVSYNLANNWPAQNPSAVWTLGEPVGAEHFVRGGNWIANGELTFPSLLQARYGESVILRNYNSLPFFDPFNELCFPNCEVPPFNLNDNGGFGRQEPTTHNHNAHNGAESDGAGNAHFFPGQYYDYLFSTILARRDAGLRDSLGRDLDTLLRIRRGDNRASTPTNDGRIIPVPGDFREIQGTMWFHDHRISFTSENVYKGYASLLEYFSGPDRGFERPLRDKAADSVNLRYPSGFRNGRTWGNRDFDVYLLAQDVAFNPNGQLFFDIIETDGFLGDVMHVNFQWKPTFKVLPRKYRFRILSAGMSRWIKLALADSLDPNTANAVPVDIIANDGNLFPQAVRNQTELSIQGTAERLDIIVDFSRGQNLNAQVGRKYYLVNMLEFRTGRGIGDILTMRQALAGSDADPAVGAIMEFEVVDAVQSIDDPRVTNTIANACGRNDQSRVPDPGADWEIPTVEPVRTRLLQFTRGADGGGLPFDHPDGPEPWGVQVGNDPSKQADMRRVSNLPRPGDVEHWTISSGMGWGHPVHLHFEEAKTLSSDIGLPATELNKRKDVWSIGREKGRYTFQVTFSEFGGAYVNHCHNTVHEDNAMLLRYDLIKGNSNANIDNTHITILPTPDPRPQGVTYVESCIMPAANPQGFDAGVDICPEPEVGPVVPSTDPRTQ